MFYFSSTIRVPNDENWRKEWISAIKEANNDNSGDDSGVGLICSEHFLAESIKITKTKIQLVEKSIPTEFWVDCIDISDENIEENQMEDNSAANMLKYILDCEIREIQLKEKIEQLQKVIDNQAEQISSLKQTIKDDREKTIKLDIEVSVLFSCYTNILSCVFFLMNFSQF